MILGLIVGVLTITFLLRSSFILFLQRGEFPPGVQAALGLVPAAVLSALVWPDVFTRAGVLSLQWDKIGAASIAVLIAWRTRNVLYTVLLGMLTLWSLRALGL